MANDPLQTYRMLVELMSVGMGRLGPHPTLFSPAVFCAPQRGEEAGR